MSTVKCSMVTKPLITFEASGFAVFVNWVKYISQAKKTREIIKSMIGEFHETFFFELKVYL